MQYFHLKCSEVKVLYLMLSQFYTCGKSICRYMQPSSDGTRQPNHIWDALSWQALWWERGLIVCLVGWLRTDIWGRGEREGQILVLSHSKAAAAAEPSPTPNLTAWLHLSSCPLSLHAHTLIHTIPSLYILWSVFSVCPSFSYFLYLHLVSYICFGWFSPF